MMWPERSYISISWTHDESLLYIVLCSPQVILNDHNRTVTKIQSAPSCIAHFISRLLISDTTKFCRLSDKIHELFFSISAYMATHACYEAIEMIKTQNNPGYFTFRLCGALFFPSITKLYSAEKENVWQREKKKYNSGLQCLETNQ